MNDRDQALTWRPGTGDELPERLWAYYDPAGADDRPCVDPATGLFSIAFMGAALRRRARLWCTLAIVGLLIGAVWVLAFPPPYKATASVLLADDPKQDPASEVLTDIALAQSTAVAEGAIGQLGLRQTPGSFLGTYTVTNVSNQVLMITAEGPTSTEAVQRASAVATQFLKFRAQYVRTQQQQTEAGLEQQVTQAQQHLDSITSQFNQVSAQHGTPGRRAELNSLRAQGEAAANTLTQVQQYVAYTLPATRTTSQQMVQGSQVLDAAAPARRSFLQTAAIYLAGGLFGGLVVGVVIVIVGAVTSDRLRRRDDIAHAFGAPVRLSVGQLREGRWLPDLHGWMPDPRGRVPDLRRWLPDLRGRVPDLRRWLPDPLGRSAIRQRDMERVVEHLANAVPGSSRGPAGLAVVAVDDAATVARAVIAVAVSRARQHSRVVLADLSAGAHAALLLGAGSPGISAVSTEGVNFVVAVPAAQDIAPVGPLRSPASPEGYAPAGESLLAACADADLVLSLVTLDPALGAEHLATWATDAVAVLTAGRSTAVRIQAVGDMVRLGGARLGSVVVIDTDKTDESLGATSTACEPVSP